MCDKQIRVCKVFFLEITCCSALYVLTLMSIVWLAAGSSEEDVYSSAIDLLIDHPDTAVTAAGRDDSDPCDTISSKNQPDVPSTTDNVLADNVLNTGFSLADSASVDALMTIDMTNLAFISTCSSVTETGPLKSFECVNLLSSGVFANNFKQNETELPVDILNCLISLWDSVVNFLNNINSRIYHTVSVPEPVSVVAVSAVDSTVPVDNAVCVSSANCSLTAVGNESSMPVETPVSLENVTVANKSEDTQFRGRKRIRSEDKWARNVRKRLQNSGLEYTPSRGVIRRARAIGPGCRVKCTKQCHSKIPADARLAVFHDFWQIGDVQRQRDFLGQHCKRSNKIHGSKEGRRSKTITYTLTVNDQVVPVCKTFFLHTLNVSDKTVTTALNKLSASGTVCWDKRGKHMNRKKVPAAIRSSVRDHIMMFPKVESHYCRANSSRQYLESGLSVALMYDLYVQHQKEKGEEYASNCTYRKIFKSDFNLSFFYTKKKINVMSVLHSNTAVMISNVL